MTGTDANLDVVVRFLNTLDERTFTWRRSKHVKNDGLTSIEALSAWFEAHGLRTTEQELRPADLAAARSLRDALRDALTDGKGAAQALVGFPLRLEPDASGRVRIAGASGVAGLDFVLETVALSVGSGALRRLKLCVSPDCRWAYFDTSRSGTSRWCVMEACGNRNKTRAYRERHAD
ncbi:CGNR zinc finger domain-containing protein [Streptomyces sp. NPDC101455]|uniref:CGNR zinc finger domain-containing protein n=1 Tax=Streptomyces sp. NPDC101455 TaxID=3366142 RepID=UPI00382FE4E5